MDGIPVIRLGVSFEMAQAMAPEQLAPLWRELQARADAPFFLDWQWIGSWLAELGRAPMVLIGRQGGRVVLLAALLAHTRRVLGLPVQGLRLHAAGEDATDVITVEYNGFLVDRAVRGQVEMAAVAFLLDRQRPGPRCDELHMKGVGGAFQGPDWFQPAELPADLSVREVSRRPAWHVDLDAIRAKGGSYLDSLSANTRQQIRRAMRLYEKRGPLRMVRASTAEQALALLDDVAVRHQAYWTGRGELGGWHWPFFARFQRRLVAECSAAGGVELFQVSAGETILGTLYNFVHRGRVLSYQSGINYEADGKLKPGLICHALCIQRHLDEGAAMYDFMAGEARYKASLGQPGPAMSYWLVARPTPLLRLERALKRVRDRVRQGK
jgi:CelD/BcsL family acetyltransferase involved in cellulose biosynthesis